MFQKRNNDDKCVLFLGNAPRGCLGKRQQSAKHSSTAGFKAATVAAAQRHVLDFPGNRGKDRQMALTRRRIDRKTHRQTL